MSDQGQGFMDKMKDKAKDALGDLTGDGQQAKDQAGAGDRAEGAVDDAKGRAQSAWGGLTGDRGTQAEGELDRMKGGVKQGVGDAKDKLGDVVDQARSNR